MSQLTTQLFKQTSHVLKYAKYRPSAPKILVNKVLLYLTLKLAPPHRLALDVGCGSGQSTGILAPHFDQVLGIDVSEAQILEAAKKETNKNVKYSVGSCTSLPARDNTVELITVSQAGHWFDLPAFYKEVERVLVPGGALAFYCYQFPVLTNHAKADELNNHFFQMYRVETAAYWNEKRTLVDDKYKNVVLPYQECVRDESYFQDMEWSVEEMVGYIQSWSAFQGLLHEEPKKAEEALAEFKRRMLKTLDADEPDKVNFTVRWNYFLLMSRKPLT